MLLTAYTLLENAYKNELRSACVCIFKTRNSPLKSKLTLQNHSVVLSCSKQLLTIKNKPPKNKNINDL